MTNFNIPLTKNRLLLLRRIACTVSFVGTAGILLLMLFGCVSLGGRVLSLGGALNLFFYVLDFGARPFISIVLNVGFAIFYYVVCIKVLVSLLAQIKQIPLWFVSKFDSEPTREAAFQCTKAFETAVFSFFLEIILSKMFLGGRLSGSLALILIVLATVAFLIGAVYFYIVNRDLVESLFVTLCRWLTLVGAVFFTFYVCNADIATLWNMTGKFFIILSVPELEAEFTLGVLVNSVLFPLFKLISVILVAKIGYCAVHRQEVRDLARSFLSYSLISLAIVVVSNGLLISSRDPEDYLNMFIKDILFVLVPLFIFFVSKNLFTLSKSAPYMEDEKKESGDAPVAEEPVSTVIPAVSEVNHNPAPMATVALQVKVETTQTATAVETVVAGPNAVAPSVTVVTTPAAVAPTPIVAVPVAPAAPAEPVAAAPVAPAAPAEPVEAAPVASAAPAEPVAAAPVAPAAPAEPVEATPAAPAVPAEPVEATPVAPATQDSVQISENA